MIAIVAPALAASVSIELDTSEVREGQTVGLTLTVEDSSPRDVPRLEVPEGLRVAFSGKQTTQTIINFQASLVTTYRYALTALAAGDYTLGPFEVRAGATALRTSPLRLHVVPRSAEEANALVAELGADVAWLGQVLVYHARFTTDKSLVNGQWAPPDSDALRPEASAEPEAGDYEVQEDGQSLQVRELFYPLRASRAGKARVPATSLLAQFAVQSGRRRPRDFFPGPLTEVRNETFSSNPVEIVVRDLPAEGRPADFTGLVGRFAVTRKASATRVATGDTVTLETTIEGDGALAGFELPAIASDAFRVYADQPVVHAAIDGGRYVAAGTWKHAIVPLRPGSLVVPELSLAVFDPAAGAYTTVTAPPIALEVEGEAAGAEVKTWGGPAKQGVDALGEDILPVRTEVAVTRPLRSTWAWTLLVPGAALLASQGLGALRARPKRAVAKRMELADLPTDREARLAGMERLLRERVAERLGAPPDAVRREDLARLSRGAAEAEVAWRRLEALRYGGAGERLPEDELRAALEALG
ncbi:MAG: BatD family protein [Myxococcota bacterium]